MIVRSAPGRLVRDPYTKAPVPEDRGIEVSERDPYWARKLADGDVVEVTRDAPPSSPPARKVKE